MSNLVDIDRYRRELDEIEGQFQRLSARREALHQFLAAYNAVEGTLERSNGAAKTPLPASIVARPNSARAKILAGVIEILSDNKPHRTTELYASLQARHIEVGGDNKLQTIARLMSGNPLFRPDRKVGWSLDGVVMRCKSMRS